MELAHFLSVNDIRLDVPAHDKTAVLQAAAILLSQELPVVTIASLLIAREDVASTGVGEGVAVPHASTDAVTSPRMAFLRTAAPVPFEAVDQQPVQLVLAILAPANAPALHLRLLARIGGLVRSPAVRAALLAATSREAIIAIIRGGLEPQPAAAEGVV